MDSPLLGDEKDYFNGVLKNLPVSERIISRLVREGKGFLKTPHRAIMLAAAPI
jgi:hypothetical protein